MSEFNIGNFPSTRLRRLRMKEFSRRMVSENNLSVDDLIWPLFVCEGSNIAEKINSMPGVFRYSIDNILKELETVAKLRIPAINLNQQILVSEQLEQTSRVMVKDEDLCLHCGLCAERCPTGAWDMQTQIFIFNHNS